MSGFKSTYHDELKVGYFLYHTRGNSQSCVDSSRKSCKLQVKLQDLTSRPFEIPPTTYDTIS